MQIAKSKGVPPYVIFSDATLKDMSSYHPLNKDEMAQISGVGEFKLEAYGAVFLDQIQRYLSHSDINDASVKGKTYVQTLQLIREEKSISEISKIRSMHENTVYSHIAYLVEKKLILDIDKYINEEEIEKVYQAASITGNTKELKPLYKHLSKQVDYGKIRLALSYLKAKNQLY